mmetsp:Transcript_163567/g.298369  ORF Transcript_163567/g.298369 Transcript_163567/m.298369 type:complete len:541 (-) Transcript_163567:30-1652(-)
MAALLLERRKRNIGNTFLNDSSDQDIYFKLNAVWTLPGSCRRRAQSVQASMTDLEGPCVKNACTGGPSDHEIDDEEQICIDWPHTDESDEDAPVLVRAKTTPPEVLAAIEANLGTQLSPPGIGSSGDNESCPRVINLSQESPYPRSTGLSPPVELPGPVPLPRLLGRVAAHQPESKVQRTFVHGQKSKFHAEPGAAAPHQIVSNPVTCQEKEGSRHNKIEFQSKVRQEEVFESKQQTSRTGMTLSVAAGAMMASQLPDQVASAKQRQELDTAMHAQNPEDSTEKLETDLPSDVTTMMIRNVPRYTTQKALLEEIDNSGFKDLYDFCYMPSSFSSNESKGFAFINLTSTSAAGMFVGAWHKTRRLGMKSNDASLNISPASIQGLEANIKKWNAPRMKRIRNPNLRPFVAVERIQKCNDSSLQSSTTAVEASQSDVPVLQQQVSAVPLPATPHGQTPGILATQVSAVHAPGTWVVGDEVVHGQQQGKFGRSGTSPSLPVSASWRPTAGTLGSLESNAFWFSSPHTQPLFSTPPPCPHRHRHM